MEEIGLVTPTTGDWGYFSNLLSSMILTIFENDQNTGYIFSFIVIFDRRLCSWASVALVIYESDSRYNSAKPNYLPLLENLTKEALVTGTLGLVCTGLPQGDIDVRRWGC